MVSSLGPGATPGPERPLDCPVCKRALTTVRSGEVEAHRCPRCRGIWLDPASFQRVCDDEEPARGDARAGTEPADAEPPRPPAPVLQEPVRYRPCPACGEVMNRRQFARVSGVIIDVCRPHGAWLDRGELASIRRFLRAGGARRFQRVRVLDEDPPRPGSAPGLPASSDDVADLILGGDRFDVPRRLPLLPIAATGAAAGVWLLWRALDGQGLGTHGFVNGAELLGFACLFVAWHAFRRWLDRR